MSHVWKIHVTHDSCHAYEWRGVYFCSIEKNQSRIGWRQSCVQIWPGKMNNSLEFFRIFIFDFRFISRLLKQKQLDVERIHKFLTMQNRISERFVHPWLFCIVGWFNSEKSFGKIHRKNSVKWAISFSRDYLLYLIQSWVLRILRKSSKESFTFLGQIWSCYRISKAKSTELTNNQNNWNCLHISVLNHAVPFEVT